MLVSLLQDAELRLQVMHRQVEEVGLHADAVFTVDTVAGWVYRRRPVARKLVVVTGRLTVRNGDT
jgi:hypothetical protein